MARCVLLKGRLSSQINVTPMADIMLVLLVIFMITTPLLQSDVSVSLPKSTNSTKKKDGPLVLIMTREGRLYCGKKPLTEQTMIQTVQERVAKDASPIIFLKADQALQYGSIIRVINQCRVLGVQRIGLMTDKELHKDK